MFIWKNLLFLYQFTFALVLREPPNGKEAVETKLEELPSTASDVHGLWMDIFIQQIIFYLIKTMKKVVKILEEMFP
jgi:hypothetical protein